MNDLNDNEFLRGPDLPHSLSRYKHNNEEISVSKSYRKEILSCREK